MGNQACGGGRKEPKAPTTVSQAPGDRKNQKTMEDRRRASQHDDAASQNQLDAHDGERAPAAFAPSPEQRRINEHSTRYDVSSFPRQEFSYGDNQMVGQGSKPGQSNLTLAHWATLQNEASQLLVQDRNDESLAKFKEALNVQVAVLGDRHPDIALTMNNLGIVSRACGRHEDAVAFFRQAAEITFHVIYEFRRFCALPAEANSENRPPS
jgi:tetratricopeptide (TPR) repeat protein